MPLEKKVIQNFKLTDEEKERLRLDAHAHNMNVSEYIRYLIEKEREEQKAKQR